MVKLKTNDWIKLLTFAFSVLFTYASLSKLAYFNTFKFQLERSPFFSSYVNSISISVPFSELIVAGLLLIKKTKLLGFLLSYFLMFLFTAYVFAVLQYSHEFPCACGGILSYLTWKQHLIFNIIFTVIAICGIVLILKSKRRGNSYNNI